MQTQHFSGPSKQQTPQHVPSVLRESQNRLPAKGTESSDLPDSPCLLNVTPQENYQSVKT